jgi:AraC family transcriptional regulator, regulatory protein of adaptative response / methylated-DNA-[protein]-cysteine methyltransferase
MTSPSFPDDDAKWLAFLARDLAADRLFYVAVKTSGIFCRSVCPARPRRENVRFIELRDDCLAAGFRACKRCQS